MNFEYVKTGKEVVVTYLKALRYTAEIRTEYFPDTSLTCYRYSILHGSF
jgi:hypothetical protein